MTEAGRAVLNVYEEISDMRIFDVKKRRYIPFTSRCVKTASIPLARRHCLY